MNTLSCPFCGSNIDVNDPDVLYPNTVGWKYDSELQCKTYHHYSEVAKDQWCYQIVCNCGAEMHGDTKEDVCFRWNRRL